jgi:hypothetical protein
MLTADVSVFDARRATWAIRDWLGFGHMTESVGNFNSFDLWESPPFRLRRL